MASGYIKLHRSIQDNPLWEERFDKARAWIDLLLLANYKPTVFCTNGRRIEVERGQLAWSIQKLAARWGWNRETVSVFIHQLESSGMVRHQNIYATSLISITNYESYQSEPAANPATKPASNPATNPATNPAHLKKYKNVQEIRTTPLPPSGEVGDVDDSFKLESDAPVNPKDRIQWNQPTGWSGITDDDKKQWQDAYPACNVEQKLKALGVWVRDNWPRSRKKNWARFISNNLARSQERGGDHSPNWTNKTPSRPIQTFSTGIVDDGRAPFWWRKYLVKLYEPLGQAKIDEFVAVKYFKDLPLSVQQDCNQEYAKERDDLKY